MQIWTRRIQLWAQETSLFKQLYFSNTTTSNPIPKFGQGLDANLPIRLAAQEAVSRYEGFLSSIGPRSRLLRKFLSWVGVIPPTPEAPYEFDPDNLVATEPHLRFVQVVLSPSCL